MRVKNRFVDEFGKKDCQELKRIKSKTSDKFHENDRYGYKLSKYYQSVRESELVVEEEDKRNEAKSIFCKVFMIDKDLYHFQNVL